MKGILYLLCAVLGLALGNGQASAEGAQIKSSGDQPRNTFAKQGKPLTPEEERLQKFWHDYYDSLKQYYATLDNVDWVAYYKNHGYQINANGACPSCNRINYAPVFVSPGMQWAVPRMPLGGPGGIPGPMATAPSPPTLRPPMTPPAILPPIYSPGRK